MLNCMIGKFTYNDQYRSVVLSAQRYIHKLLLSLQEFVYRPNLIESHDFSQRLVVFSFSIKMYRHYLLLILVPLIIYPLSLL